MLNLKKLKNSQEIKFALIGGLNTALDFAILFSLSAIGMATFAANTISTGVTFASSFMLNKKITFQSAHNDKKELVREMVLFIIITLIGLWGIQNAIIATLSPFFDSFFHQQKISLLFAKAIATAFSMVWNFVLYKKIVFRKQK